METGKEVLGFQAEVKQLLHLMIHSLYANKEIFLRELISNASDACDRLRFAALTDPALLDDDGQDLTIRVAFDPRARTITVADNGIGMSRDEVVANIGTIAKSGTREFLHNLTGDEARDAHLIGQFGVGFYSSFIVADRVTLTTRRAGLGTEHGVRWESGGEGEYTVEVVDTPARGTAVVLHLRDGEDELLNQGKIREIVRKYSDHITIPIVMAKEAGASGESSGGDVQLNQASALWARRKADITEEQYHEFYKHVAHDFEAPLAYTHSVVEGRQQFTLLLYVPQRAPFDVWTHERRHGIKLYIRRVFVRDDAEQLMPAYLRFVRGVIDANDLPLNVSREILQHSRDVEAIRASAVKRVLSLLEDLAQNHADKYTTFWTAFGTILKEGAGEDEGNRERIAKLLRFASTRTGGADQTLTLADYVARMKAGQRAIYYITAESFAAAANSPHLEVFRKHDLEVLLLSDRVDEWLVSHLTEFDGTPLESVAKGDLDLGDAAGKVDEASDKRAEYAGVLERLQEALADKAKDVRWTDRLTESPACLVSDRDAMGTNLERLLKAAGRPVASVKPILEINPRHPIVERLRDEPDRARFTDLSHILFDQAVLAEGGQLDDPAAFVKRLNALVLNTLGSRSRIWVPGE